LINPPNSNSFIGSLVSTSGRLIMILVFMFLAKAPSPPPVWIFLLFCILSWSSLNNPWVQGPNSIPWDGSPSHRSTRVTPLCSFWRFECLFFLCLQWTY
jgi:hypothetical protein